MNRNISLASRDPLPLGREDIYKGMEEIGAYLDVTPRDFQEIYAHAYKIARGRLLSSITAGDIMHVPVLCVAEEQAVRDLVIFLDDHRISGAPAVDADGRLSGVVSESDVVRFVGGGALSKVTCQMLADITGRTVETVENTKDVGAIGAAMLAAVGSGLFPDLAQAASHVKVNWRYTPNTALKPVYDRNYRVFRQLYASNKKNFALLNRLKEG